jgi:hypothetical protein
MRLETACREGPVRGPAHLGIEITFDVLVQCCRPAGDQQRAEQCEQCVVLILITTFTGFYLGCVSGGRPVGCHPGRIGSRFCDLELIHSCYADFPLLIRPTSSNPVSGQ